MDAPDAASGDFVVRPATDEDWPAIGRVTGRSPTSTAALRRSVEAGFAPWCGAVATPPGLQEVVGIAVAGIPRTPPAGDPDQGKQAHLLWIEVLPAARGRGAGRQLLDHVLDDLRERDVRGVSVTVEAERMAARALFHSAGFAVETEFVDLALPAMAAVELAGASPPPDLVVRPLSLDDVAHTSGLMVELGVERAASLHDDLEAFTPGELERWLQRRGAAGYAGWERRDPLTPVGVVWASRTADSMVLRFVGVQDLSRRQGVGRALIGALVKSAPGLTLTTRVRDPGEEMDFFRALGFAPQGVTYEMRRAL